MATGAAGASAKHCSMYKIYMASENYTGPHTHGTQFGCVFNLTIAFTKLTLNTIPSRPPITVTQNTCAAEFICSLGIQNKREIDVTFLPLFLVSTPTPHENCCLFQFCIHFDCWKEREAIPQFFTLTVNSFLYTSLLPDLLTSFTDWLFCIWICLLILILFAFTCFGFKGKQTKSTTSEGNGQCDLVQKCNQAILVYSREIRYCYSGTLVEYTSKPPESTPLNFLLTHNESVVYWSTNATDIQNTTFFFLNW